MNLTDINIYTQNKQIISFIKNFLRIGRCNIFSPDKAPKKDEYNIYIISKVPMDFYSDAKYIVLTDTPASLDFTKLDFVYDIWPATLTMPLLKFFLGRLIEQIHNENIKSHTEEALREMAHQDYLTGLATRWYLHEYFQNNENQKNLTCIYFDLDNFKEVNDTYGHQTGDKVLASTAEIMRREFSDGFVARMGGDEFMVVLTGKQNVKHVEERVNGFMEQLAKFYADVPTMKHLSVSGGIAQRLKGENKSIDTLINESDTALYDAKKAGKNCCKVYKA